MSFPYFLLYSGSCMCILNTITLVLLLSQFGIFSEDIDVAILPDLFLKTLSPLPQRIPRNNRRGRIELDSLKKENQQEILSTKLNCSLSKFEDKPTKRISRNASSSKVTGTPELDRLEQRSRAAKEKEIQLSEENTHSCQSTRKRNTDSKSCISSPKKSKLTNEPAICNGKVTPDNKHDIVKCVLHVEEHATHGNKLGTDKTDNLTVKRRKIKRDNFRP